MPGCVETCRLLRTRILLTKEAYHFAAGNARDVVNQLGEGHGQRRINGLRIGPLVSLWASPCCAIEQTKVHTCPYLSAVYRVLHKNMQYERRTKFEFLKMLFVVLCDVAISAPIVSN
jgi:hypothetical protein